MDLEKLLGKLTKENKKKLEGWIAEIEEKIEEQKKTWKPEDGDQIYCLKETGEAQPAFYVDYDEDQKTYEQGNAFETKELAEFEAARRKYLAMYERMSTEAGELSNEWDGNNFHYAAFYDNGIRVGGFTKTRDMNIHFPSEETCRKAIESIGEGNFIKYILRIGE